MRSQARIPSLCRKTWLQSVAAILVEHEAVTLVIPVLVVPLPTAASASFHALPVQTPVPLNAGVILVLPSADAIPAQQNVAVIPVLQKKAATPAQPSADAILVPQNMAVTLVERNADAILAAVVAPPPLPSS